MNRQGAKAPRNEPIPAKAGIHGRDGLRLAPEWRDGFSAKNLAPWRLGGVIFFVLLSLSAPAFAASVAGDWYGEGYQPLWHENAQWLMHLSSDGVYAVEFRQYRYCQLVLDQKETGTWTLSGDFRTVTTRVNGAPTHYENDYRVGALTDAEFDITHIETGQAYVEKRVAADFKMPKPDCPTS